MQHYLKLSLYIEQKYMQHYLNLGFPGAMVL